MMKFIKYCFTVVLLIVICSCAHYKDIPYFQNSAEFDGAGKEYLYDMKIKTKDRLTIFVFSPTDQKAASMFKVRNPPTLDFTKFPIRIDDGRYEARYYLVENDGCIDYPLVGKIHLEGLTIEQAKDKIKEKIASYFQKDVDFLVNVICVTMRSRCWGKFKNQIRLRLRKIR